MTSTPRAAAIFVPHGGGPLPLLGDPSHALLADFWKTKARDVILSPVKPKAILLITAHWEENEVTISSGEKHDLYYDYYGFPSETYKITYPAPGNPEVAKRAHELLTEAGIPSRLDSKRGWDHGVFVPLIGILPEAEIPVVQMSLKNSLDPSYHLKVGHALSKLRDEGVAVVGSGMSFHNMSAFRASGFGKVESPDTGKSRLFDAALTEALTKSSDIQERDDKLSKWETFPGARFSHPREEHLIPLFVVAGAGENDPCIKTFEWEFAGYKVSSWVFGEA